MGELERERPSGGASGPEESDGAELRDIRRQADALLAAGDEAIRRALSADSEAFLRANRQEGGQ